MSNVKYKPLSDKVNVTSSPSRSLKPEEPKSKISKSKKPYFTKEKLILGISLVMGFQILLLVLILFLNEWVITHSIRNQEEFLSLSPSIKRLRILANSINEEEFVELQLSRFRKLKKIIVEDFACIHVKSLEKSRALPPKWLLRPSLFMQEIKLGKLLIRWR